MFILFACAIAMYILFELYVFFVIKRAVGFCCPELGKKALVLVSLSAAAAVSLGAIYFSSYSLWLVIILHIMAFNLLVRLINFILKRIVRREFTWWDLVYRFSIIPLVLTAVFFIYGYYNMSNIVRTSYTIDAEEVTVPFKIALLADIHYGTAGNRNDIEEAVRAISRENPDIAVLCGDITDESASLDTAREIFGLLGEIKTEHGVYFVYGNHDCSAYMPNPNYSREDLEGVIAESGIEILSDEYKSITNELILAGRLDKSMERKTADELLDGADKNKFILLADHQPTDFREKADAGVSAQISGHTHGGQIFPVGYINTLISPNELCYGMDKQWDMTSVVTSGVYGWGFPIRTQGHSEWVLIEIK